MTLKYRRQIKSAMRAIRTCARETNTPVSKVSSDTAVGLARQTLNKLPTASINHRWNAPNLERFKWLEWAGGWNDLIASTPRLKAGDWSRTIFVAGFLQSGSSAVADCLYDSLDVPNPPTEIVSFRDSGARIPRLMTGAISLQDFVLQTIVGVAANPWHRRHAWLPHAVSVGLEQQISAESLSTNSENGPEISMSEMAHSFLAPSGCHLVLDNALYREILTPASLYQGAVFLLVIRNFEDQYAQLTMSNNKLTPIKFAQIVKNGLQASIENLKNSRVEWVAFEQFVIDSDYRDEVCKAVVPGITTNTGDRFQPEVSRKNIGLGARLDKSVRKELEGLQESIYGHFDVEI